MVTSSLNIAGMFGLGAPELMVILLIMLVLFGGSKLPQLARGLGESMKEFKKASRDDPEPAPKPAQRAETPAEPAPAAAAAHPSGEARSEQTTPKA